MLLYVRHIHTRLAGDQDMRFGGIECLQPLPVTAAEKDGSDRMDQFVTPERAYPAL